MYNSRQFQQCGTNLWGNLRGMLIIVMLIFVSQLVQQSAIAAPSLLLQVTASATTVEPGESVTFTINYRCASLTEHCEAAQIVNMLPNGMDVQNYSGASGLIASASENNGVITWGLQSPGSPAGRLEAGTTGVISVKTAFPACLDNNAPAAGSYTNSATFTATGASEPGSAQVTLNTTVPACPVDPPPTNDLIKEGRGGGENGRSSSINGYMSYNLTFPSSGSQYTVIDNIPSEFVVTRVIRSQGNNAIDLEIQCGTATWHTVHTGTGPPPTRILDDPSDLPTTPAATSECEAVPYPGHPSRYLFNITAVRWTIPSAGGPYEVENAIQVYIPDSNPFAGSGGPGLPSFSPASAGQVISNCIVSSDNSMGSGGQACHNLSNLYIDGAAPFLRKYEYTGPVSQPREQYAPQVTIPNGLTQGASEIIYGVEIAANALQTSWDHPMIVDLLDPNLSFSPFPAGNNWWTMVIEADPNYGPAIDPFDNPACYSPTFSTESDFNGSGRQLLRWDFSGCTIPAGFEHRRASIFLYFSATIKPGTAAATQIINMPMAVIGEYNNQVFQNGPNSGTNINLRACNSGSAATTQAQLDQWPDETDLADLDNDGDTTELLCKGNTVDYSVPIISDMASSKWIKGKLDTEFSRFPLYGDTDLTSVGIYELYIKNSGNVNVTDLDVVDILPFVGDLGLTAPNAARLSEWNIELDADIFIEHSGDGGATWAAVPAGDLLNGTPLYAASTNPCRFDSSLAANSQLSVTGNLPASCTALSELTAAADAQSFGFRYSPASSFLPGEELRITVPIRVNGNPPGCDDPACAGDTVNNNAIAWNSFAFGGTYNNGGAQRFLDTEPIKVGLRMIDVTSFTSLGNKVWHDVDGNGLQSASEPALAHVTVSLYATGDLVNPVQQTQTDTNGFYRFDGLVPNTSYVVRLDNPADFTSGPLTGMSLTGQDAGDDTLDSDAAYNVENFPEISASVNGVTGVDDPADPSEYPTFDFGFWQPASLGDYVWYDTSQFGDQNEDLPVSGAQVTLWSPGPDTEIGGGDDVQVLAGADGVLNSGTDDNAPFVTGADGAYEFSNLPAGLYYVRFDISTISGIDPVTNAAVDPADWKFTSADSTGDDSNDSDAIGTGSTPLVFLSAGEHNPTIDAGIKPVPVLANPVSVGNRVWEDTSPNNGQQDGGESGIAGVKVELLDSSGFLVDTTYTDTDGKYRFDNLESGEQFEIVFTKPQGYQFVASGSGSDSVDSDADETTGSTGSFTLDPAAGGLPADGEATSTFDPRWDAGMLPRLSLGNRVWHDLNDDGRRNPGEPVFADVTVNLLEDQNGAFVQIRTKQTDNKGRYVFRGLDPATYVVEVEIPAGLRSSTNIATSTTPELGDDDDDNGVDSTTNAGFVRSNPITLAYSQAPTDEADHGQPVANEVDTTSNRNANYTLDFSFNNLSLDDVEIGNYVWIEDDGDGIAGNNGVDQPVSGVVVTATSSVGQPYTATTTASGFYTISVPASDTYTVTVATPTGHAPSTVVFAATDSDPIANNNENHNNSGAVVQVGTENNYTIDFGFTPLPTVGIGNQVWEDGNDNGLYDVGEDVIPNLLIELWEDVDNDGIAEPLGDDGATPIITMATTASGQYSFTNLLPGNYFVRIPAPPPATPLSSIPISAPDNGVDNDDNGDQPGGPNAQILSPVINLAVGEEPGTAGGGSYDDTVDFGLVDPFIGNLVWHDQNNNGLVEPSEPGIAGVTMTVLYDANASGGIDGSELTPFRTTQTDSNGLYVFPDLIPDSNYQVVIPIENFQSGGALENLPYSSTDLPTTEFDNQIDEDDNGVQSSSGMTVTSPLIRIDVDGEPVDGNGTNDEFGRGNELDNGDDNNGDMTIDFGFYQLSSVPSLAVHKSLNGDNPFLVGRTISFTIQITNTGNVTITTLPLEDRYSHAFITYDSATPPPTPGSVTDGIIIWDDLLATDPDGLGINETISVDVFFTTVADTSLLPINAPCTSSGHAPNLARSIGATADAISVVADGDDTSCDSVQILNPTAVPFAGSSIAQTVDGVLVRWHTLNENNIVGFQVWRSNGVDAELRSREMIVAKNAGQTSGTGYEWLDAGATLSLGDAYLLEIVKNDGSAEHIVVDVKSGDSIFLPLVAK